MDTLIILICLSDSEVALVVERETFNPLFACSQSARLCCGISCHRCYIHIETNHIFIRVWST
jgi:hypothetical protein